MDFDSNRYIITGGSGSGKSSIIYELQGRGYTCYQEISRIVIYEQQMKCGDMLPWMNMEAFAEECFRRMKEQLNKRHDQPSFFDRGIPDITAYLKSRKLPMHFDLDTWASCYNSYVFVCPPWKDIFVNDPQRPESFSDSKHIYQLLRSIYRNLNFIVVEVPRLSVKERADYILATIKG